MSTSCIPGSVLVGVDGSPGSDAAVSWAAHYAAAHRRPLALVHAAGDIVPTDFAFDLAEARHSLRAAGRQVLDRAHALARATEPSLEISAHLELHDAWLFPAPDVISPTALHELMEEWDVLLGESLAGYGEKYPDVRVRRRLVQETPAQALVGRSETASTVVVGSRGRSALTARVLGSVSRTVAEHGRCTVVVVRGDLS